MQIIDELLKPATFDISIFETWVGFSSISFDVTIAPNRPLPIKVVAKSVESGDGETYAEYESFSTVPGEYYYQSGTSLKDLTTKNTDFYLAFGFPIKETQNIGDRQTDVIDCFFFFP